MISPTIFLGCYSLSALKKMKKTSITLLLCYFFLNKPLYYVLPFSFLFSIAAQGLICSL